ncbi:MAG: hypothetical protein CMP00_05545 [Woeseiaceae bacterium]|nr:hypothetical protein [Woeseiaceae bacterium]|tara:strand:+ start:570 stop:1280 length:711 start_codon:yes stop_codon:yes gene_type:complete
MTADYDKYMVLKLFVEEHTNDFECNLSELKQKYIQDAEKHNNKVRSTEFIDAGFDLYAPYNVCVADVNSDCSAGGCGVNAGNGRVLCKICQVVHESDNKQKCVITTNNIVKLNYLIKCSAQIYNKDHTFSHNTGYYLYPRSSIYKTDLRAANSVGIIDAGYRGNIMSVFDVINRHRDRERDRERHDSAVRVVTQNERYAQICAPSLIPIVVEVVDSVDDLSKPTARGMGGFGSTGV